MNDLIKHPAKTGLMLLAIFILLSVFFVFEYAKNERARDLMDWQVRLSILADMRVASVEEWLDDKKSKLDELANNSTLKLYLSQYSQFDKNDTDMQAQFSHVRNLLQATSTRFGFSNDKESSINIGQKTKSLQGIAVLSAEGNMLFSTAGFYNDLSTHQNEIKRVLETGKSSMIDLFKVDTTHVLYGFILPVFHIQKGQNEKSTGAVILLLDPVANLYKQLENIHVNTKTDESLLIRKTGLSVEFLSPLQGSLPLLYKMPSISLANVISQDAVLSITNDYNNKKVLSLSRPIRSTSWLLIQKVDASEALQESDEHQQYLFITFFLISMLIVSMMVAIWRHSTSVRLLKITDDLETQTALLHAVSDNINEHIFLVDENDKFVFANYSLAKSMGVDAKDVYGKDIASVMGTEVSKLLHDLHHKKSGLDKESIVALPLAGEENIYHVSSVVLKKGEYTNAKLFVLHDITMIEAAQEKRDKLSKGIISTLVKAVDLYDPYCVEHSERTREVASDIAHEMGLASDRCEMLEMAALLANIGKLFVPKQILIKMDALTDEENLLLRNNVTYAVDVLKELEFEGPVVKIISQKNERLDGTGYPEGIRKEDIMLEARILAVSNAFVAMASSRAYREGKPIKEVINILLDQSDIHYDRQVIAALFHIAENKNDWKQWQNVVK